MPSPASPFLEYKITPDSASNDFLFADLRGFQDFEGGEGKAPWGGYIYKHMFPPSCPGKGQRAAGVLAGNHAPCPSPAPPAPSFEL